FEKISLPKFGHSSTPPSKVVQLNPIPKVDAKDDLFQPTEPLYKELTADEEINMDLLAEPKEKEEVKPKEEEKTKKIEETTPTQPSEKSEEKVQESLLGTLAGVLKGEDKTKEKEEKSDSKPVSKTKPQKEVQRNVHYPLPAFTILAEPPQHEGQDQDALLDLGKTLMQTLKEFGIDGELSKITPGPVVTLFSVLPAKGVKVSKFLGVTDDIARVLKAQSVRILAPVPGTDTVGVEIPNVHREIVTFKELGTQDVFQKAESPLTIILGKDTSGNPATADLARMPHMLIAGATGTGKSVCLNSILASILYHAQPDTVKLLLIDPKRVEMSVYADEPHLIHPVVNEPQDAKTALQWATTEMERRFKMLSKLNVRNIVNYNKRLASYGDKLPPKLADLEPLPYIAIVIDELADLMMTSDHKEVESCIVRLAQLARAAGIHMILATQRPSVNVVTGIIKANFPCRVSFQVAQSADSRTILDTVGAEKLLGKGDMLYKKPDDTSLQRLHGAFLSDEEVGAIVEHWKQQCTPEYKVDFTTWDGRDKTNS
ncbi:MAG: DNA translocase FtsK, partial [Desulfovibrio sp.]|nr:DNA translocase FtsK [Desulfovibrio sp.]